MLSGAFNIMAEDPIIRDRLHHRVPSNSNEPSSSSTVPRRRSSLHSISSAQESLRDSADDLWTPRAYGDNELRNSAGSEVTNWHSIPLIFALLPAIGGLIVKDGAQIITDILLLGIASIFLNWSVKLPWQWYHDAQQVIYQEDIGFEPTVDDNVIYEDDSEASASSPPSPRTEQPGPKTHTNEQTARLNAESELRKHEFIALLCCLLFPVLGAFMLHGIRAQLSRPSEGLVSNFNLSIFLLASEIRPLSHLIKLIRKRTLFLQRVVAHAPPVRTTATTAETNGTSHEKIPSDLLARIERLEDSSANPAVDTSTLQQKITTDVRLSVQPSLDALNRAVRRYEKRATLQSMQTESRLHDLEARLQDALVLAAAAAKGAGIVTPPPTASQGPPSSSVLWTAASAPFRLVFFVVSLPLKLFNSVAHTIERLPSIIAGSSKPKPPKNDSWDRKWDAARQKDTTTAGLAAGAPSSRRVGVRGRPTRTVLGK